MSEAIRKHLKKLGSMLPSLRKQKDDESLSSEPSKPELIDVHYGCDSCSQGIKVIIIEHVITAIVIFDVKYW